MHITAVLALEYVVRAALMAFIGYVILIRPLVNSFSKIRVARKTLSERAAEIRQQQNNQRNQRIREMQAQEEEQRLARNARQRERRAAQRARQAQETEASQERKGRKKAATPPPKPSNDEPKSWLDRLVEDDDIDGV